MQQQVCTEEEQSRFLPYQSTNVQQQMIPSAGVNGRVSTLTRQLNQQLQAINKQIENRLEIIASISSQIDAVNDQLSNQLQILGTLSNQLSLINNIDNRVQTINRQLTAVYR